MKKITLITLLFFVISINSKVYSNEYYLNEELIETAFNNSEDITSQYMLMLNGGFFNQLNFSSVYEDNTQIYAAIAGGIGLFLGIGFFIPIHRLMLGTNGQFAKVCALYCITVSGLGLITLADIFMMLVDETKSKYINNPKFIMWAN